jgi:hypothetical protein
MVLHIARPVVAIKYRLSIVAQVTVSFPSVLYGTVIHPRSTKNKLD